MNRPIVIAAIGLAAVALAATLALRHGAGDVDQQAPAAHVAMPADSERGDSHEPSFDVVRVDRAGDAVIAGRAMPKAEVVILDGETEIGRTIADNRGEWVFVPNGPLRPGARELRLRAHNPDGTVTDSGAPVVLVVPELGTAIAIKPLPGGGVRVLQGPAAVDAASGLALDVVDHDGRGRLFIGGKAPAGRRVHVYLDNRFIGRAEADGDGVWRLRVKGPETGNHVVRADLVGEKGKVVARVEIPYAPAEDVAMGSGLTRVKVEPGASLWRIARKAYGSGTAYTVIFAANRERIRDPDMIYPGQVFTVPAK